MTYEHEQAERELASLGEDAAIARRRRGEVEDLRSGGASLATS